MREGIVRRRAVEVVDMPVLDAVAPRGELHRNEWPMFGFLDGHDVVGGCQIGFGDRERKALIGVVRDALLFQAIKCVARDWAVGATIEREAARFGGPLQPSLLGLPVEKDFSETAAVEVAGTEE